MVESKYLYNNEAVGMIALCAVLKHASKLSYSKSMLVLPFLFHEESVAFLKRSNSVIRSFEEIIVKKVSCFGNFNARYSSLLPISINSIMILQQCKSITIDSKFIIYNQSNALNLDSPGLGKRAVGIVKAAEKLAELLVKESETSLYLKLRIQI